MCPRTELMSVEAVRRISMWSFFSSVAVFSLFTSSAAFGQKALPKGRDRTKEEIVAAVVRQAAFATNGITFLKVDGQDPSPQTLRMLSDSRRRILPASRAVYVRVPNEVGYWKDKKTGEPGRYFEVESCRTLKDGRVEVFSGWEQPCGTYTVVFNNGAWSVDTYKAWLACY